MSDGAYLIIDTRFLYASVCAIYAHVHGTCTWKWRTPPLKTTFPINGLYVPFRNTGCGCRPALLLGILEVDRQLVAVLIEG